MTRSDLKLFSKPITGSGCFRLARSSSGCIRRFILFWLHQTLLDLAQIASDLLDLAQNASDLLDLALVAFNLLDLALVAWDLLYLALVASDLVYLTRAWRLSYTTSKNDTTIKKKNVFVNIFYVLLLIFVFPLLILLVLDHGLRCRTSLPGKHYRDVTDIRVDDFRGVFGELQ